jgi:hypothetical protein
LVIADGPPKLIDERSSTPPAERLEVVLPERSGINQVRSKYAINVLDRIRVGANAVRSFKTPNGTRPLPFNNRDLEHPESCFA